MEVAAHVSTQAHGTTARRRHRPPCKTEARWGQEGSRREGRVQFWHAEGATGWPEQEIAAVDRNAWYITPLKLFPEWHRSGQSEAGCARILET